MAKKIVVIGSGAAGMTAASSAREANEDAEIVVFTEEEHVSYSPCAIPFVLEGKIKDFDSIIMHTPEWYRKERSIEVRTRTKVTGVDVDKKTIALADGTSAPYDSLVLATGGTVFVPPIEGADLPGVHKVRFIKDGMDIQKAMASARHVVVAGAGVIGLEVAVALRHAGLEVTVVEMFPQVIPRICDADMAKEVQSYCESLGIKFVMGAPLQAIQGEGRVQKVVAGGKEHPADLVVMATGVRANLELPNQMGLEIGGLGAVRVSPTLQPYRKGRLMRDVFLAGDLVMCESAAAPGPTMSQLGGTGVRMGRVAGINAAGGYATFPAVVSPWVSQIGDVQIAGTGLSCGLADYYGMSVVEGRSTGTTRARYYPGGKKLIVKLLADRSTHRIVGGQILAGEEATGRINWISAAILNGATVEDFVTSYENAYCPPTSMVKDVVNRAAEDLLSKF
ncbi:NAD(P)/FAD-dependent oxidoreductase [Methanomassiliicoccus luminyensis]|uniref:NAD(P)/FAD-dependent oxidoreductase n=1 Tax=Methanomassiliicoccus luminyensis TaxID=1080712 RepID=UPI00036F1066|nr:FAD-dependent oxidoreductase [Methanomassiliicoccus luminyensis]